MKKSLKRYIQTKYKKNKMKTIPTFRATRKIKAIRAKMALREINEIRAIRESGYSWQSQLFYHGLNQGEMTIKGNRASRAFQGIRAI